MKKMTLHLLSIVVTQIPSSYDYSSVHLLYVKLQAEVAKLINCDLMMPSKVWRSRRTPQSEHVIPLFHVKLRNFRASSRLLETIRPTSCSRRTPQSEHVISLFHVRLRNFGASSPLLETVRPTCCSRRTPRSEHVSLLFYVRLRNSVASSLPLSCHFALPLQVEKLKRVGSGIITRD